LDDAGVAACANVGAHICAPKSTEHRAQSIDIFFMAKPLTTL